MENENDQRSGLQLWYVRLRRDQPELELAETADEAFYELENGFDGVRAWLIRRGFRNWHKQLGFLLQYIQMIRSRSPLFLQQKEAEGATLKALVIKEIHPDGKTLTVSDPVSLSKEQIKNRSITEMRGIDSQGRDVDGGI